MMVFSPKAFISIVISILIHIIFIMKIFDDETKDQEIYVLNLSSYQQVQFEKQKTVPKEIVKEPKVDEKKKIEKKVEKKIEKLEKKLPIQPIEKIIKQNEIDDSKILEKKRKENFVPQKQVKQVVKQSSQLKNIKNKILIDKILGEYLKKISIQINRIATQSYPLQSIKRREQGTIRIIITLNENGEVLELFFENKKPKRLYKATKKIIESFTFPKPSKEILTANNTLRVKIPVNFILK